MPEFWPCNRIHKALGILGGRILGFARNSGILKIGNRMIRSERDGSQPDEFATTAEVTAAIESLSAEQFYRLKQFARFRIRGLGRAATDRAYGSLLAQAVALTLEGAETGTKGRRWAKNRVP